MPRRMTEEDAALALGRWVMRFYRRIWPHGFCSLEDAVKDAGCSWVDRGNPGDVAFLRRVEAALEVVRADADIPMAVQDGLLLGGVTWDKRRFKQLAHEYEPLGLRRSYDGSCQPALEIPRGLNVTDIEDLIYTDRIDPTIFELAEDGRRPGF